MQFNIWVTTETDEQLIGNFIGTLTIKGWKAAALSSNRAYISAGENQLALVALKVEKQLKLEKDETSAPRAQKEIALLLKSTKLKWFSLVVVNSDHDNSSCWNSNLVSGFDEVMKTMVIR